MSEVSQGAYNTQPAGLEKMLDETFRQKAPFQLPFGLIKWFADNSWWIVLVGAVLSVLGVVGALNTINQVAVTSTYLDLYGVANADQVRNALYLSILSSIVSAVLLFLASPKLRKHEKAGWNLLYYNFLINFALSLVSYVLFNAGMLVASLIGLLIGFVIGVYILFQLRPHFTN